MVINTTRLCNTSALCITVVSLIISVDVGAASIQLNQAPDTIIDSMSGYSSQINITSNINSLINTYDADYATLTSATLTFSFQDDNEKSSFTGESYTDWVLDEINSAANGGQVTYYYRHHSSTYNDNEQEVANLSIDGATVANALQTSSGTGHHQVWPSDSYGTDCEATWAGQICSTRWNTYNWETVNGYAGAFTLSYDLDQNQLIALESGFLNFSIDSGAGDFLLTSWALSAEADLIVNTVPVPAAAWLFGSGLIGLVGLARRKA